MTKLNALALAFLALGIGGALAHGDEDHAKQGEHNASKVRDTDFGCPGDFQFAYLQPGH